MSNKKKAAQEVETRGSWTLADPGFAEFLGLQHVLGSSVTELSALGVSSIWRAVSIIAGTIAGLPLKTYVDRDGTRERVPSLLDSPAGPFDLSSFSWKEMVMAHLLLQGESFLEIVRNNAGAIVGLWPVHPLAVDKVAWNGVDKVFTISMADGSRAERTSDDIVHVMGLTTDGTRGIGPIQALRRTIQLGIDSEKAAARAMGNGAMISGLVTPEQDLTEEEAKAIKAGLKAKVSGPDNAGDIAVVNRALKFAPWAMSNVDAQFIESRAFQVEEIARIFGVPPHLLAQTEKQTSWGTGVSEQNQGLARYTLMPWTSRLEEALSDLLPDGQHAEFDYSGLLQGSPADEIHLLIEQVAAGLLTKDEARAIRNLPPLPKGGADAQPA